MAPLTNHPLEEDARSRVFQALGDRELIMVMQHIFNGATDATALAEKLASRPYSVSRWLAGLRSAGLISTSQSGRRKRIKLEAGPVNEGAGWFREA